MRAWLVVVACGCGRIGFDAHSDANGDGPLASCAFREVELGRDHTCAIDGDGVAFCWGRNDLGQVTGTPSGTKQIPTTVTLPAAPLQLAAGRDFTCARVVGDDVYCWGDNTLGQLGIGSQTQQTGPVKVDLGGDTALDIDAGTFHTCVIRASDRSLVCWGENQHLAVGTGAVNAVLSTPTLLPGTQGALHLGLGHRHGCATFATETRCWGRGEYGQLATVSLSEHLPQTAVNVGAATTLAAGGRHSCAVDASNALRCWGRNGDGELGRGTSDLATHSDPGVIATDVTAVSSGTSGTCAIRTSGALSCWGEQGPADGTFDLHLSMFDTPIVDAQQVSVGFYHSCVIRKTGELLCWGSNTYGELGRGTRSVTATPTAAIVGSATAISVGGYHGCALSGGATYCWGSNISGELGIGTRNGMRTPTLVPTGLTAVNRIAAGAFHTCASGSGVIACWGENSNFQAGPNATLTRQVTPVSVPGFLMIDALAAGDLSTCAVDSGTVKCWGGNGSGQLGNNSTTSSATFVTVNNISNATDLCLGAVHACATDAGVLKCWGGNQSGQLGDNSQTNRLQPVTVTLPNLSAIACGNSHTCALDNAGKVYCWGRNASGELGLGNFGGVVLVPTQVTLPGAANRIVAGGYGTCARLTTGAIYCWGDGGHGELGNGILASTATPVESPMLADSEQVSLSLAGGCALHNGVVSCFGEVWILGNGDNTEAVPMSPSFTCTQ